MKLLTTYYKDNGELKATVKKGNQQIKKDKRAKVANCSKMAQAVKDVSQKDCQKEIFNAIKALSLDLITSWKTSSNDRLEMSLN